MNRLSEEGDRKDCCGSECRNEDRRALAEGRDEKAGKVDVKPTSQAADRHTEAAFGKSSDGGREQKSIVTEAYLKREGHDPANGFRAFPEGATGAYIRGNTAVGMWR